MNKTSELGEAMEYTITTDDIEAYLATKQDGDVIGITAKARECYVAHIFQHKYPGHDIGIALQSVVVDGTWHKLPYETWMLQWDFDMLHKGHWERPITKREWLEARKVTL